MPRLYGRRFFKPAYSPQDLAHATLCDSRLVYRSMGMSSVTELPLCRPILNGLSHGRKVSSSGVQHLLKKNKLVWRACFEESRLRVGDHRVLNATSFHMAKSSVLSQAETSRRFLNTELPWHLLSRRATWGTSSPSMFVAANCLAELLNCHLWQKSKN